MCGSTVSSEEIDAGVERLCESGDKTARSEAWCGRMPVGNRGVLVGDGWGWN